MFIRRFFLGFGLIGGLLAGPVHAAGTSADLDAMDRIVPAAQRTDYAVLGTAHLAQLPASFKPDYLSRLIDKLAQWRPAVITVEALSGPQCELLLRYQASYPGVAESYCLDPAEVEGESKVSLIAAEAALPQALVEVARSPTPAARRRLAMLFLSANDRTSALVQWLRLPEAERVAADGLTPALVAMLEKARAGRNENYALAAPLAARLGHERVYPVDDHTADSLTAPGGDEFGKAMMAIWDNPSARALRPRMEAREQGMTSDAAVLSYYRWLNQPATLRPLLSVDFGEALRDRSAQQWGRRYVAWWEVRNLRMVAAIREAAASDPGGRVLSIVGSSHKPYFERYLAQSQDARIVDVQRLLN